MKVMFTINDDLSIHVTRGDIVAFHVTADDNGSNYKFQPGDVVRLKVYGKKDAANVVLQKDFPVTELTERVQIYLTEEETRIGGVISKPTDYWYEVELNPYDNPQTIIGYDEDGAKVFRLYPEGDVVVEVAQEITPRDIPLVDAELDLTSTRPVQNRAVAKALAQIDAGYKQQTGNLIANIHNSEGFIQKIVDVCKTYTDNFSQFVYGNIYTAYDVNTQRVSGKWQMDCSSFLNLLIRGVTYENSRYGGGDNKENPLFFNKFDPYEFRLANTMAKWLYENGYTYEPAADFSNIEAGDLVFYSWPYTTGEFHDNAFLNIDHVAMFLQKKNDAIYQTIQYEQYTPNFFYDVDEEYMSSAVLAARLPFPMVENTGGNLILNSEASYALENSDKFFMGEYLLERPMIPGKMYTCCFKGKIETEGAYFLVRSADDVTLYSNYGEAWNGKEEEDYKFTFICPDGLEDYTKLLVSCSIGGGNPKTASVRNFCLYEGYKRFYVDSTVPAPYPIYREFKLASGIANDLEENMAASSYVLEFRDYFLLSLNIPLKTLRSGTVLLGSLGMKLSETRRLPANMVANENNAITHYNGYVQISGGSTTGDVYAGTWNSQHKFQYVMVNGMVAK